VSVPPCAAAASLKIPVFTHDSDYSPGLATRINARFAEKIFVPYKESAAFFPPVLRGKVDVSGNPIRPAFASADPARGRAFLGVPEGEPILLVLGGSLGSREINNLVRASLPGLTRHYTVVHQTGAQDGAFVPGERYKPYPYFNEEMPHVIAAAELVLCRSGAGTIWECAGLKKPMILLPLRGSGTRGDQVENAQIFEKAGAALNLAGDSPDASLSEKLVSLVALLAKDEKRRAVMAQAKFNGLGSADYIARTIARKITEGQ
jgi:UDP-N-acetylglucosamine--N-acetylmuramyl-(pentapeptide) pyrophosphoryl-undecaprenol N-acetylglucosamine transferase